MTLRPVLPGTALAAFLTGNLRFAAAKVPVCCNRLWGGDVENGLEWGDAQREMWASKWEVKGLELGALPGDTGNVLETFSLRLDNRLGLQAWQRRCKGGEAAAGPALMVVGVNCMAGPLWGAEPARVAQGGGASAHGEACFTSLQLVCV
jgi:hypothetical protein